MSIRVNESDGYTIVTWTADNKSDVQQTDEPTLHDVLERLDTVERTVVASERATTSNLGCLLVAMIVAMLLFWLNS